MYMSEGKSPRPNTLPSEEFSRSEGFFQSRRGQLHISARPKGPCRALEQADSDQTCGGLGHLGVTMKLRHLWGDFVTSEYMKRCAISEEERYLPHKWLNYFINHNYPFGVLNAWVSACNASWQTLRNRKPEDFSISMTEPLDWKDNPVKVTNSRAGWVIRAQEFAPRRVWDLKNNKVIPTQWLMRLDSGTGKDTLEHFVFADWRAAGSSSPGRRAPMIVPISHAWVSDPQYVTTAINNKAWVVPIPKGVSLEKLRDELLGLVPEDCQYAWLDVLCLRQKSKDSIPREDDGDLWILEKEWELDVPLIGQIYSRAEVTVLYFNGLGRPLAPNVSWDDIRHWTKRAWTIQEAKHPTSVVLGGYPKQMPVNPTEQMEWTIIKNRIHYELLRITTLIKQKEILGLIVEMGKRFASTEIDRVAGLTTIFQGTYGSFPIYQLADTPSTAWSKFCNLLTLPPKSDEFSHVYQLLQHFPYPSRDAWFPSWEQVLQYPDVPIQGPRRQDHYVATQAWGTPNNRVGVFSIPQQRVPQFDPLSSETYTLVDITFETGWPSYLRNYRMLILAKQLAQSQASEELRGVLQLQRIATLMWLKEDVDGRPSLIGKSFGQGARMPKVVKLY
ncbi:hypothetical protein BGX38DRAFT_1175224 [Terfezia claveryi]|nr:hypothetical protein BGX38DRAFT_1175224 [Terfezia claveryi]